MVCRNNPRFLNIFVGSYNLSDNYQARGNIKNAHLIVVGQDLSDPPKISKNLGLFLHTNRTPAILPHMDHTPYDDTTDEMTREEAIAELMAEGYSRDEAIRMIGDYEADEYEPTYLSDFPDQWSDDVADFVDPEDFE